MTTKKVTTLQSATGVSSPIMIECRDDVVHFTAWTSAETNRAWANPKRADVLAALGIDELGCGCDEADTNLKKALARAEDAEAEALEQAKLVRTWADRAEKAEAELAEAATRRDEFEAEKDGAWAEAGRLAGRLADAEVTIERIKAAAARAGGWLAPDVLQAALTPPTRFELPTSVPARIEAKRNGKTYTFYLWTNGAGGSNDLIWVDEDDWTHSPSPARLMADFTGHRLIEAES